MEAQIEEYRKSLEQTIAEHQKCYSELPFLPGDFVLTTLDDILDNDFDQQLTTQRFEQLTQRLIDDRPDISYLNFDSLRDSFKDIECEIQHEMEIQADLVATITRSVALIPELIEQARGDCNDSLI